MTSMQRLEKELIADTSICNLLMRVGRESLDVAVYSVVSDNSFIHRSFPLVSATRRPMGMLEDAIYDNPLLLADFRRSYCIVESQRSLTVPAEIPDPASLLTRQWPDFDGEVRVSANGTSNTTFVWGIDTALAGFLRRTFPATLQTDCHLAPLTRYFAARPGRGNSVRAIANLREGSMDMLVLRGPHLLMANTFVFDKTLDALYYIMAARDSLGLDPQVDEMLLAGHQPLREELSPLLRKYIARVMPVIFPPQMFKAGMEALSAPFDLIVTPLCE